MSNHRESSFPFSAPTGLAVRLLLLVVVLLSLFIVTVPIGYWRQGEMAIPAALSAFLVTLLASGLSLLIANLLHAPDRFLLQTLLGMAVRMTIPLVWCLVLRSSVPVLMDSGAFVFLLVYYLGGLTFETWLMLEDRKRPAPFAAPPAVTNRSS